MRACVFFAHTQDPPADAALLAPAPLLLLRRLERLCANHSYRLGGMLDQFDPAEKGYLTEKELVRTCRWLNRLLDCLQLPPCFCAPNMF